MYDGALGQTLPDVPVQEGLLGKAVREQQGALASQPSLTWPVNPVSMTTGPQTEPSLTTYLCVVGVHFVKRVDCILVPKPNMAREK